MKKDVTIEFKNAQAAAPVEATIDGGLNKLRFVARCPRSEIDEDSAGYNVPAEKIGKGMYLAIETDGSRYRIFMFQTIFTSDLESFGNPICSQGIGSIMETGWYSIESDVEGCHRFGSCDIDGAMTENIAEYADLYELFTVDRD